PTISLGRSVSRCLPSSQDTAMGPCLCTCVRCFVKRAKKRDFSMIDSIRATPWSEGAGCHRRTFLAYGLANRLDCPTHHLLIRDLETHPFGRQQRSDGDRQ